MSAPRTFIIGGTVADARAWCRANGLAPYSKAVVIATHEAALRGHTIRPDDRVVWAGEAWAEDLIRSARIAGMASGNAVSPPAPPCPSCGKPEGSFACKVRHIHLNTGDAKAARD